MSRPKPIFVDTSIISSNIFNYCDDEFYSIIGQLTGLEEAGFLKVQGIRTANSFLRIENVFDVLTIDAEEITKVKKDLCFMLNDNTLHFCSTSTNTFYSRNILSTNVL